MHRAVRTIVTLVSRFFLAFASSPSASFRSVSAQWMPGRPNGIHFVGPMEMAQRTLPMFRCSGVAKRMYFGNSHFLARETEARLCPAAACS